jgi:hypothetical protein
MSRKEVANSSTINEKDPEESKIGTPIPAHKKITKENSLMLDFTDYMS